MATKSAIDALLEVSEQEADDGVPRILVVSNENTGDKGYFHLIGTNLYWASINNSPPTNVEKRLRSGHYVSRDSMPRYAATIKKVPDGMNNLLAPVALVQGFIVSSGVMTNVLKETLLSTIDDIFSWKYVTWKIVPENILPITNKEFINFYKSLLMTPGQAISMVTKRNEILSKSVEQTFPFTNSEVIFDEFKVEQEPSVDINILTKDETAIVEKTIDYDTLNKVMHDTGMPPVVFMKNLISLYKKKLIRLYTSSNERVEDVVARYKANPNVNMNAMETSTTASRPAEKPAQQPVFGGNNKPLAGGNRPSSRPVQRPGMR